MSANYAVATLFFPVSEARELSWEEDELLDVSCTLDVSKDLSSPEIGMGKRCISGIRETLVQTKGHLFS